MGCMRLNYLKYYRKEAGLTRFELAEKAGTHYAQVWQHEERRPEARQATVARFASALGIHPEALEQGPEFYMSEEEREKQSLERERWLHELAEQLGIKH